MCRMHPRIGQCRRSENTDVTIRTDINKVYEIFFYLFTDKFRLSPVGSIMAVVHMGFQSHPCGKNWQFR